MGRDSAQYREGTRKVVEEFLGRLKKLSWKTPQLDSSGFAEFPGLFKIPLSGAAATAGGSKTLEQLQRGVTPVLAGAEGVPYSWDHMGQDDGLAWSEIHKDPRILAEVQRLSQEARQAKKTFKKTRGDVRKDQTLKQVRRLHEANKASGLSANQSVDLLREVVNLLEVEVVQTT